MKKFIALVSAVVIAVSTPITCEAACGLFGRVRAWREARVERRADRRAVCANGVCEMPKAHNPLAPPPQAP